MRPKEWVVSNWPTHTCYNLPLSLILFNFWSFLGPSAYEWIEKKLAPRQNKARTGELVAAGENGMGAVVLRIIDAQIDPAANNLNSSWVKLVSQAH